MVARSEALGIVAVAVGAVVVATLLRRRRGIVGGNAPGTPPMLPVPPGFGGGTGPAPSPPPPISRLIPRRPALPQPIQPPRPLLGGGIR